jgi:hypothetical protein
MLRIRAVLIAAQTRLNLHKSANTGHSTRALTVVFDIRLNRMPSYIRVEFRHDAEEDRCWITKNHEWGTITAG